MLNDNTSENGYQDLECFILTTWRGSLHDIVALESKRDGCELAIVLAGDLLTALHAQRWGNSHIHLYDWRLTFGDDRWTAEARPRGASHWTLLTPAVDLAPAAAARSVCPIVTGSTDTGKGP